MNTRNTNRITFCPGPGAKLQEWSTYQNEFFGRGDPHYQMIKKKTLNLSTFCHYFLCAFTISLMGTLNNFDPLNSVKHIIFML